MLPTRFHPRRSGRAMVESKVRQTYVNLRRFCYHGHWRYIARVCPTRYVYTSYSNIVAALLTVLSRHVHHRTYAAWVRYSLRHRLRFFADWRAGLPQGTTLHDLAVQCLLLHRIHSCCCYLN